jgi:GT2 family glycosyltransferase
MVKLCVNLVTWNGAKYIPYLFESLRKQDFQAYKLHILDNASTDNTVKVIKDELSNFGVQCEFIQNNENIGFARGHSLLNSESRMQNVEYVLLLNQDMYLESSCMEKMVEFMDKQESVAAASPRLMRWDFNKLQVTSYKLQDSFTNKIDSLGLRVFRNRRVVEKYTGKDWGVIKPKMELSFRNDGGAKEVFGVSGALPIYRCSVIKKVGLFDESFGSYKEDVDLAFRLRSAGYKAYVLLDAVAYHDRSALGLERITDGAAVKNKGQQAEHIKYNSYKNHLITLYKNEYWQNFLLDLPWILWYEGKKFWYFFLFDRQVLGGLKEIWDQRKSLKTERMKIKNMREAGWRDMRRWFN